MKFDFTQLSRLFFYLKLFLTFPYNVIYIPTRNNKPPKRQAIT